MTGRKKDLLIVAGRNFYPQDIEEICGRCEGAIPGRSVALGAEDATLGTEKIVVLVESRLATADETARLAAAVRQRVFNDLDCPVADVRVVPHMWLLKTSSGKIARYPNLQKYQAEFGAERKIPKQAPRPRRAGLLETAAWAFAVATCIYFYSIDLPPR